MPHSQFKLSLPSTWTTIDSLGDSVTEAIRSGSDLRRDALLRLESQTFSGHLSARDAADLTIGRLLAENPRAQLAQAVDRDFSGTGQAVRIVVDRAEDPPVATAYVMIAEAPEDVRTRVVPTLIIQWAEPDADALGPEFEHVISSFRFTPPASYVE
ncbi:hypothetical protein [Blastococcus sp. Marseille-P5729]|uniref:hypothetical protein n=1 Tax=Blastococcus sp. Marseille-P5729 TaxID=2086582 RepID=UPI000D114A6D|nr:hypothetical protein [Blastococcus sp. Marseille-P5729]